MQKNYLESLIEQYVDLYNKSPKDKRILNLQKICAVNWMLYEFEKIYRLIYGSQIQFLYKLSKEKTIASIDAQTFFAEQLRFRKFATSVISFRDWMNFLTKDQKLVLESNSEYTLTNKGITFLDFMDTNSYDFKNDTL